MKFLSKPFAIWFIAIGFYLTSPPLVAETVRWQGFDIHYTTFSSMLIPADVAAMHDIARAQNRIVTNVSILKDGVPQRAEVSGQNTNLLNQLFGMTFTEVRETTAVYYLSNQLIDERDTLRFEIDISPEDLDDTFKLKFMRQY